MAGKDHYAGAVGRFYSFYIARPRWARVVGKLLWSFDSRPLYRSLDQLSDLPEDSTVLDVACGAGLALGWLDPHRTARYIGIDNSPAMLERARQAAERRGFHAPELQLADVAALPCTDAEADVVLLYNSLHVVDDPPAAVQEAVRCLAPGGPVHGAMLLRGVKPRVDWMLEAGRRRGEMGPGGTATDLTEWLRETGLADVRIITAGSLATFSAVAPRLVDS